MMVHCLTELKITHVMLQHIDVVARLTDQLDKGRFRQLVLPRFFRGQVQRPHTASHIVLQAYRIGIVPGDRCKVFLDHPLAAFAVTGDLFDVSLHRADRIE